MRQITFADRYRRTGTLFTTLCLILFCLVHVSCSGKQEQTPENKASFSSGFLKRVRTVTVTMQPVVQELVLTGKVEYDPDRMIRYAPLVSGVVDATYFSLGDRVSKGQTLADVRSSEFSNLRSEMIAARSAVEIAGRELRAAASLYEDGMLSEKEWLEAQAAQSHAEAELKKTEHEMALLGADKGNGAFSMQATMSGYVVEKNISSGSTIAAEGDPLFAIADLSQVWVTVNVYAGDLRFVKEGMEVEISMLSYPGEVFHGRINTLSQVFDPEERVLKARVVMPNPDLRLKPEMSVTVRLKESGLELMAAVPSGALIFDCDHNYVVVEVATGEYEVREVVPGGHQSDCTFLRSGLAEGEKVVVQNHLLIYSELKGGY